MEEYDPNKDLYKRLGVEPSAKHEEIRAVHRKLALSFHPDHLEGLAKAFGEEVMRNINDAWEVLGDRDRRAAYDEERRRYFEKLRIAAEAEAARRARESAAPKLGLVPQANNRPTFEKLVSPFTRRLEREGRIGAALGLQFLALLADIKIGK